MIVCYYSVLPHFDIADINIIVGAPMYGTVMGKSQIESHMPNPKSPNIKS